MTHPHRARLPIIPDLRFERGYLRSITPYVHFSQAPSWKDTLKEDPEDEGEWRVVGLEKGKGKERERERELESSAGTCLSNPPPDIRIEWGHIALITVRDQVLSPLLQGALWGVASHFLQPFASLLGFQIRKFFALQLPPPGEGSGVGWLRSWARSIGLGTAVR